MPPSNQVTETPATESQDDSAPEVELQDRDTTIVETNQTSKKMVVSQEKDKQEKPKRSSTRKTLKKGAQPKAGTTEDQEESDEEEPIILSDMEKDTDGTSEFITVHWDGIPPVATGTIAKRFAATSKEDQFQNANEVLEVTDGGKAYIDLKATNWTPFLVAVPGAFRKVKVVYGATLHKVESEERLLVLHGEYIPGISFPQTIELPTSALKAASMKFPTGSEFGAKRKDNKCADLTTWFTSSKVKKLAYLPFMVPVPPCLVYDAIQKDIDVLTVYERWMVMREEPEHSYTALDRTIRSFLKGQLVSPSARHAQGRLDVEVFLAGQPEGTLDWSREQIKRIVPTPAVPRASATTTSTPMAGASVQDFATAFVSAQQLLNTSSGGSTKGANSQSPPEPSADSSASATLGMSKSTFERHMGMCGLVAGEENLLPRIWYLLAEKLLTSTDKKVIVRTYADANVMYRDAKLKLYHQLVQMVIKRDFEEEITISCLRSAVKGLTPFAVPDLSDEEANRINEQAQALEMATTTTIKDVSAAAIKLTVPTTSEELTKRLKRFVNLIFLCFGESCPLLKQIEYLIADLEDYTDYARASMSKRTIASTIWLVHVQSRYFARGYMNQSSGRDETLPTFDVMSKCIMNRLPVVNGDVPPILYLPPPTPRFNPDSRGTENPQGGNARGDRKRRGGGSDREVKRSKIVQNHNYHQHIKTKMASIVGDGRRLPRVSLLCQKSGARAVDLFPGKEDLCIKATLYGTCFGNCQRKHDMVTDAEAKEAMEKLKLVIENPALVKVNNN